MFAGRWLRAALAAVVLSLALPAGLSAGENAAAAIVGAVMSESAADFAAASTLIGAPPVTAPAVESPDSRGPG